MPETVTNRAEFPSLATAPGLDKRDGIILAIAENIPLHHRQEVQGLILVDEAAMAKALDEAFRAGSLAAVSSMQACAPEAGMDVDVTNLFAYASTRDTSLGMHLTD